MSNTASDEVFQDCPRDGCDGRLQHQTREATMCLDCEETFTHEVRSGGRHLLWAVDRAGNYELVEKTEVTPDDE